MPTPRARSSRWIHRYLPALNLAGFAVMAASALLEPGDLLAGNPGYAPLRWLPETGWVLAFCAIAAGQALPGLLALWRPPPAWMGRIWWIGWTMAAAAVWGALGGGLATGPTTIAARVYLWLAWVELTRIGASEVTKD